MKKIKAHILIVDDDERIRELVKQYLNDKNYLITTANDAADNDAKFEIDATTTGLPGWLSVDAEDKMLLKGTPTDADKAKACRLDSQYC